MDRSATLQFVTAKLTTSLLGPISGVSNQAPVLRENKAAALKALRDFYQTQAALEADRDAVENAIKASRVDQTDPAKVNKHAKTRYLELLKEFPK